MLFLYLIISNVMLVNLLIAIMAATYEEVAGEAEAIWSIQNIDMFRSSQQMFSRTVIWARFRI